MAARMSVQEVAEIQFAYPTFTQAIGLMHSLSVQAAAMVSSVPADGAALEFRRARQRHAGPTFEYLTPEASPG